MGICIVKKQGIEIPTKLSIENCLKYNNKLNIAFNKDGLNYIVREISNYKELIKLISDYDITSEDSFIIKVYSAYNSENEKNQPLIITDDYKEMTCKDVTEKSVIIFHKDPSGINNIPKDISKEMFFTNMLSRYNYFKNKEMFNLAVGDNKAAILYSDGTIDTWCCSKTKGWEENDGILFSDDDYKYSSGYSRTTYGGGWEDEEYNYYNNYNNYNSKYCTKCNQYSATTIYVGNKPYCSKCYKTTNKKFICYTCSKELNVSQMSKTKDLCILCSNHINSVR